jgi:surface protein
MKRIFIFTFLCLLYSCNVLNLDGSKPIIEIKDGAFDPNTGLDAWGYDPLSATHVSAWNMPAGDLDLTLPIIDSAAYNYDFTIDWGDGTVQTFGPATGATLRSGGYGGAVDHTYSQPGIYTIEITGTFERWSFKDLSTSTSDDNVNLIRVHSFGDLGYENLSSAFEDCTNLTHFAGGYTQNVINMLYMFSGASGITSLDLSNFDTSSVTNMGSMFDGASGLTSLDLSNFDTSSVTRMSGMFEFASGLTSLDLSNFDTSSVTSMQKMFFGATGLTSLDLTNWDTSGSINYTDWLTDTTNLNKATGITCIDPDDIGNYTVNGETCN